MLKKILVAYDGSESAKKAFDMTLELAKKFEAAVEVVAVAQPPEFAEDVETEALLENAQRQCQELLEPLKGKAASAGIDAHLKVAVGHPAEQVVYHAEEHGIDLIVMGHRGRTFLNRWLLGSVSKRVMAHAPCSVMVVR